MRKRKDRIRRLEQLINDVVQTRVFSKRTDVDGDDAIGRLGQSLNSLLSAFEKLNATEHLDDVAELAIVRTAPGILAGHAVIGSHLDEIKTRNRSAGNIRFPRVPVKLLRMAGF